MLSNHNGKIVFWGGGGVWLFVCLFVCLFLSFGYIYKLSIYKARKPREANETYVKGYLKTPSTKQKNTNAVIAHKVVTM